MDALSFLLGTWIGESQGAPGDGQGTATFSWELGGKILVQRGQSAYKGQGGEERLHEQVLMFSQDPEGVAGPDWDHEGHGIRYRGEL